MDNHHQGRYFFIDTNPSAEPKSNQDSKSYDSDSIDEEIEHRLYSLVHHSSEADSSCTTPLVDVTKSSIKSTIPLKKHNVDDLEVPVSKRRKTSPKVLKKDDFMAPSTSSSSTVNTMQGDNFNSTIYLSDSDEDNESEVNSAEGNKNLWHIDYKDILIANPVHGKFYRPKIWCSRCRKEGNHPVKLCHLPKYKICYICGEIGHLGQHCKNQHCKRCMDFHPTSKCSLNVRDFQCRICHKHGHLDDNCPNHWRKYHQITDEKMNPDLKDAVIYKNEKVCCGFCGKQRHYAYECDRLRQRNIEVSSPFDFNTTFGGNFHPNRSKPHRKLNQTFKPSTAIQAATGRRNYRQPRYFAPKNQEVATDPSSIPQITIQNNRKKSKSEKRNKKKKTERRSDDSVQIISGPSIHSGRVEKSKTRQQHKRRNRKAVKNSKTQYFDTINLANSNIMIGFRR